MIAGRMKSRITITPPAAALDGYGQRQAGTPVTCWAELSDVTMAERASGQAVLAAATRKARIRYRDVDAASTVTADGVEYAIVGVDSDARWTWRLLYLARR